MQEGLKILNAVCREICGKRGTILCASCRVEELREQVKGGG